MFNKGFLFYAEFNTRLFFFLLIKPCDLLFANDLDTLLPTFWVKKIKRKQLIYDSHEYFIGVPELSGRRFVQFIWRSIEKRIFPKIKDIITVNDSIASLYSDQYNKQLTVIRNVPERSDPKNTRSRKALGLPEDKKIFILQGSGINVQRGAEEAVYAMKYVDNAVLLIVGAGDVLGILKKSAAENDLSEKVIFIDKQPMDELFQYTSNADIGLTLDKDTNLNYRFSLPNKLFDYIHAGIPVFASDLPEVKKIVKNYGIGVIAESHDPIELAQGLKAMISNEQELEKMKENCKFAAAELCWEKEEPALMKIILKYA